MRLSGKVIVVTGGSGLLGRTILEYIRREDATAINAEIAVNTDLEAGNVQTDITDERSVKSCIEAIQLKYGRIDGWINNAYPRTKDWGSKFENIPLASWRQNVDMHQNGYFLCCQLVLEQMRQQGYGSLVNIASIYGVTGPDFTVYEGTEMTMPAAYAAIKGAIVNLTRYLASYYGKYSIRVNCVSPGGIFDNQPALFVEKFSAKVPLKRMGTPDDIAPALVFLLSEESKYITGHNLMVDGGWSAI